MLRFKWETKFKGTKIGEIPKDWELVSIGNSFYQIIMGQSPPSRFYNKVGKGIPFIQGRKDFNELYINPTTFTERCSKIAPAGSVLITVRAPVGDLNITKKDVCIGRGVAAIYGTNKKFLLNRYLYYVLLGLNGYIISIGERGTTYNEITKRELENLLIPSISYSEQSNIATVLSWFDDLIENKKRQNEILEKTAAAIFKNWFIDFEPFKEKEFVYNEEVGRKIPKGWEVKSIGEVAEFVNGFSYRGSEKFSEPVDGGYVFVTLNNVKEGGGFKTEYAWIKSERLKERHFLKEGDLIFANTEQTKSGRLLGTPAFVVFPPNYERDVGIYSCDTTRIIPNSPYLKFYLYLVMLLNQKQIAQSYHTGTSIWHFARKQFMENYHILFPPQGINRSFHSLVEPLFQKILLNQKQIMVLRKIRDVLLPKLVFGKLRVEEI